MTTINFLSANVPLTKTFTQAADGRITKDPYPHAFLFTSHPYNISTALELNKQIKAPSLEGHCLLKGALSKTLDNERRKGTTSKTDHTAWIRAGF